MKCILISQSAKGKLLFHIFCINRSPAKLANQKSDRIVCYWAGHHIIFTIQIAFPACNIFKFSVSVISNKYSPLYCRLVREHPALQFFLIYQVIPSTLPSAQSAYPYSVYAVYRRCCSRIFLLCRYETASHGNIRIILLTATGTSYPHLLQPPVRA